MKKQEIGKKLTHKRKTMGLGALLSALGVFAPILLASMAVVLVGACQRNGSSTKDLGDGILQDSGSGSYYPRFVAKVLPCPKGGVRPCVRELDGLPPSQYTVQVILGTPSSKGESDAIEEIGWTSLEEFDVYVSVELVVPNKGEVIGSFDGVLTRDWHSWKYGDQNFFSSPELEDLSLPEKVDVVISSSTDARAHPDMDFSIGIELHAGGKRI